jgi:modulator of FtsH protease
MQNNPFVVTRPRTAALELNTVIRNTYSLLSLTLLFSALMAFVSTSMEMSRIASLFCSIGALLLMWFVLPRTANSGAGIGVVFAITGLLGLSIGPMLNHYLALHNGAQLVMTSLGGTGVIFLGLSGYALTTRKNFSFMAGFLMVGMFVIVLASIGNIFFHMPALQLAISAAVIMLMAGFILYETSQLIHDPNANYIVATVSLYLSILNIFTSLLQILGVFSKDD